MRKLMKTLPTFILAFILAVVVWTMSITGADPTEERTFTQPIPIEVINLPGDMIPTNDPPEYITLTVSAPRSILTRLEDEPGLIQVAVDMSEAETGEQSLPIEIDIGIRPVRVVSYQPDIYTVELEKATEREFPVEIILQGDPAIGFQLDEMSVTPQTVKVLGAESITNQITNVVATLDITNVNQDINQSLKLQAVDASGHLVSDVNIEPNQVRVSQKVVQLGGYRTLVVKVSLVGQIADGYRLTSIQAFPQTITVFSSDPDLVDDLPGYVETEPLQVTGVKDDLDVRLGLNLPAGISVVGENLVQVQVGIAAIESSVALSNMPVEVVGVTSGLIVTVSPSSVDIIISGPLPLLDKLTTGDVRVVIEMFGEETGTYQRVPEVIVEGSDLVIDSILPETVEVVLSYEPTNTPTLDGRLTSTPSLTFTITKTPTITLTPTITPTPSLTLAPTFTPTPTYPTTTRAPTTTNTPEPTEPTRAPTFNKN